MKKHLKDAVLTEFLKKQVKKAVFEHFLENFDKKIAFFWHALSLKISKAPLEKFLGSVAQILIS